MAALFQQMLCKKCSVAKIELIEEIVNTSIKGINFSYQKNIYFAMIVRNNTKHLHYLMKTKKIGNVLIWMLRRLLVK